MVLLCRVTKSKKEEKDIYSLCGGFETSVLCVCARLRVFVADCVRVCYSFLHTNSKKKEDDREREE